MKNFLTQLEQSNLPLYYFGWVCLLATAGCLALIWIAPVQVLGTSAWFKPFKFFLSTAIFVWSMAWYVGYLGPRETVNWYAWGLIVLFTFEDVFIAIQAGRGQLSHFNVSTPFYALVYGLMALAAVAISVWTAYIGVLFFVQPFPQLSDAYLWGIRWGIFLFVVFSLEGLVMGGRLSHSVGGPDGGPGLPVVNWSPRYGDLRVAHFLGMHALQIIPILAYYALRHTTLVFVVGTLYGLLTLGFFWQALQGKPLFRENTVRVETKLRRG